MLYNRGAGHRRGWISGRLRMRLSPRVRFYYGWVIVGVLALTVTVSYGVLMYAFPVVLAAMQAELGWSQPMLTGGYSVGALVGGVAAIPVGRWLDRHGPRQLMTASAALASVLLFAWSQVRTPWAFYAIWIGIGACSAGLFYEPAFATIAQWFHRRRGHALTIITVAGGLASTIFVPLTAELMQHFGWRGAVMMLAGLMALLTILPHGLALRRWPADSGLLVDGASAGGSVSSDVARRSIPAAEALHSESLRWLVAAFTLSTVANMAFAVHLIPLLLERGHPLAMASLALASVGIMKLIGRVIIVPMSARISVVAATVLVLFLQAAGLLVLMAGSSVAGVAVCVALFGIGDGASTPARAELVAQLYGSASYGTISGVVAAFLAAARALGPVGASVVYTTTGGYQAPLLLMTVLLALAGCLLGSAVRTSQRYIPSRV